MTDISISIKTFIGAKDFQQSREFYNALGFTEVVLNPKMSYFTIGGWMGFYLQDYYVKDWVENTLIFMEVNDVEDCHERLKSSDLQQRFKNVRIGEIIEEEWGLNFFVHDPSGIIWHFGKPENPKGKVVKLPGEEKNRLIFKPNHPPGHRPD